MSKKTRYNGPVEPLPTREPFYMVIVENSHTAPSIKHNTYEDAFNEAMRLSKKENKTTFVTVVVSQIELIPNVTQF